MKINLKSIEHILNCYTPGGYEDNFKEIWYDKMGYHTNSLQCLPSKTLTASLKPKNAEKKIMLSAHLDEISFTVTYISDEGFIYFREVGGWDRAVPIGQQVKILHNDSVIDGVISRDPVHLLKDGGQKIPTYGNLYVDIGALDRLDALDFVNIGDPIIVDHNFTALKNNFITGRALDNKIGIATLMGVAEDLADEYALKRLKNSITYVASAQEETTMLGALTACCEEQPTEALVIDVALATDTPSPSGVEMGCEYLGEILLQEGPVIAVGGILNKNITDKLIQIAEDNFIPYQLQAYAGDGGTEADYIATQLNGVPTGLVSIPCRYMHSTVEVVNMKDVENAIKLITEYCLK